MDAAAYVGPWPFRAIEGTVSELVSMMRSNRVRQAVVSPLDGFFYTDPGPANERLRRRVGGRRNLWAAPVLNLRMADWEDQLEALAERRRVRAVRLAPGFHGYTVAEAGKAVEAAAAHRLTSVVQIRMEDERHHRPLARPLTASLGDVVALAAGAPGARVVAAAARLAEVLEQAEHIPQLKNLWVDTSHLDGLGCMKEACNAVGARRLLFSTNWPFFYARSALLKMEEAEVRARDVEAVMGGNARAAFGLG